MRDQRGTASLLACVAAAILIAGCATEATTPAPAVSPTPTAEATEAVKPAEAPPSPEVSREPSASDGWTVADLSALEAAFESGDIDQMRALFADDGIMTTAWNTIALYYGDTSEAGTFYVNAEGFRYLATVHRGEDFTVLGTPIQVGDNAVAFGWEVSSGVSGTALLHLRDGKIVVAILTPSQASIPWMRIERFPTGKWTGTVDGTVFVAEFLSDGTWTVTGGESLDKQEPATGGMYKTDKDTLTFVTDSLCKELGFEEGGTYTWTHANDELTLKTQKDECTNRIEAFDGRALTPVK